LTGTVAAAGTAFVVAGALVPLLVRFAIGRNLLDVPNLRSSHDVPTPRFGGVAIMLGTLTGAALLPPEGARPLHAAATLVGAVGLVDDVSNLHFGVKLTAQTAAASALILVFPPPLVSGAPPGPGGFVAQSLGVLWVVALTNAFNFMDGIDGITGGVALVNALFLSALVGEAGAFLPALAGATAGFLVWNVSPASIFIGDSGSYFVGFGLAAAALYAPSPEGGWTPLGFVAGALVFTPYLFDTAYTLAVRLRARKNVFDAHREHIYQRITPTVAMHRRTSNLYYGASVVAGFAALLVSGGGAWALAGAGLALACCWGLAALPRLIGAGGGPGP
jgi:UDP-N-acetylmuramyl pentapeptide phosphotransferase/UDP-N-acetylglucosamine-1-phosphate transferase